MIKHTPSKQQTKKQTTKHCGTTSTSTVVLAGIKINLLLVKVVYYLITIEVLSKQKQ